MGDWVRLAGWSVASALKSRRDLTLENVALRHQLMVLQRLPGNPRLKDRDRLFWIWLRRVWPGWRRTLVLVQPATVVNWHRNGFRAYWRWKSRAKGGRPRIDPTVQKLIRDMWNSNPTWGKPRIQAELRQDRNRGQRLHNSALPATSAQPTLSDLALVPRQPPR